VSGRKIFLTGATGFIGSRVAHMLVSRGDTIRCLVRDASRAAHLAAAGAELIQGDVTDSDALLRGARDADAAIHLAAIYDVGVVDRASLERTNIQGTDNFLAAITVANTPRAIYVSSTVALGPVAAGIGDERTRHAGSYSSVYEQTKTVAHERALAAQAAGSPVIIACPAYVYGPGDNGPGGRFLIDLVRRRVPGLLTNPAWFSFVHVDDVAAGIVAALDRGADGDVYVLSGEDATINQFAAKAASLAGVRPPFLRFPPPLARMTGMLLDGVTRATRLRFPITRENVDTVAGHRWLHSHAKATQELGWKPRSLAEGLPETVSWAKDAAAT
jgi:nucleoside-diphosphate-sugar epimerase